MDFRWLAVMNGLVPVLSSPELLFLLFSANEKPVVRVKQPLHRMVHCGNRKDTGSPILISAFFLRFENGGSDVMKTSVSAARLTVHFGLRAELLNDLRETLAENFLNDFIVGFLRPRRSSCIGRQTSHDEFISRKSVRQRAGSGKIRDGFRGDDDDDDDDHVMYGERSNVCRVVSSHESNTLRQIGQAMHHLANSTSLFVCCQFLFRHLFQDDSVSPMGRPARRLQ